MVPERFFELTALLPPGREDEIEGKLLLDGFASYFVEEKFFDGEPTGADRELHIVIPVLSNSKEKWLSFFDQEKLTLLAVTEQNAVEWVREWINSLKPFEITPGIWVNPYPDRTIPIPENSKVIRIIPSFAFGTGHHATTSLAAILVAKYIRPGDRFLDVGCGTAILSIIAFSFGAGTALAVDNDPLSVRRARETAEDNQMTLQARESDLLSAVSTTESFDFIAANIVTEVLVKLLTDPKMRTILNPGGQLILSGIHPGGAERLAPLVKNLNLELIESRTEETWTAWALKRPA